MEFYICKHCGNVITYLEKPGPMVVCCGEEMQRLQPNTVEAAVEKHVPVIAREGDKVTVTVSSTIHPMVEEHYIQWIVLETEQGRQRKALKPGQEPVAVFALANGDKPVAAYEYCNLHGLWKSE